MLEILHEIGSRMRHSPVLERQTWLWQRLEPAWQGIFGQLSGPTGFATHINGDVLRLEYEWGSRYDRPDQRAYEPIFYGALTGVVRAGMTVFDIGAHIGIFTLGAAKRVGPAGKVFAFEPSPAASAVLKKHVAFNEWQDRVEVVREVASDVDGKLPFFVNGTSMAASLGRENVEVLSPDRPAGGAVRLDADSITLDRFCAMRAVRPDVIKIDVEGAELKVLLGARGLLERVRPEILCEVHPRQMKHCGSSLEELRDYLADVGYAMEPLSEPNPMGIFHGRLTPKSGAKK